MKKKRVHSGKAYRNIIQLTLLCLLVLAPPAYAQQRYDDAPQRFFLPETAPGTTQVMASGLISTGLDESGGTFTADFKAFYFSIHNRLDFSAIVYIAYKDGFWSYPEVAAFSGVYQDADPFVHHNRLFFASTRPLKPGDAPGSWNIWVTEPEPGGWTNPQPVLTDRSKNLRHPSVADSGNIYFTADYQSDGITFDFLGTDIYVSRFENGTYSAPETVGQHISSAYADYTPCIDPNEHFLIFASNRPDAIGNSDLFLVVKTETGEWGAPQNLGELVNTPDNDHYPTLTSDGQYLLFTSDRRRTPPRGTKITYSGLKRFILGPGNGFGDIYLIGRKQVIPLTDD